MNQKQKSGLVIGVAAVFVGLSAYVYPFASRQFLFMQEDGIISDRLNAGASPQSIANRQKNAVIFDFQNFTSEAKRSGLYEVFYNSSPNPKSLQLSPMDKEIVENKCRDIVQQRYPDNTALELPAGSSSAQEFASTHKIISSSSREYPYIHDYVEGKNKNYGSFILTGLCKGTEYIVQYEKDEACTIVALHDSPYLPRMNNSIKNKRLIKKGEKIEDGPFIGYIDYASQPDEIYISYEDQVLFYRAKDFDLSTCRLKVKPELFSMQPDNSNRIVKSVYSVYRI